MKRHYVIFHAVARCEYDFNENYHLPRAQREISKMLCVYYQLDLVNKCIYFGCASMRVYLLIKFRIDVKRIPF